MSNSDSYDDRRSLLTTVESTMNELPQGEYDQHHFEARDPNRTPRRMRLDTNGCGCQCKINCLKCLNSKCLIIFFTSILITVTLTQ